MAARAETIIVAGLAFFLGPALAQAQTGALPLALANDPPPASDAAFDAAFTCPESLPDDKGRRAALVRYFHWVEARHPDWSTAEAVEHRKTLMINHQCTDSLRDLATFTKRENK